VPAIEGALKDAVVNGTNHDWAALAAFVGYGVATRPTGWWFVARSPFNPADEGMDIRSLPPIDPDKMSAVHAALAASILERLGSLQASSRKNARRLIGHLDEFDFVTVPHVPADAEPVFLRLPVVIDRQERADRLFDLLWQQGIGVSRSYWRTLPDLFSGVLETDEQRFPGAVHLATCLLTLPTHAYLTDRDFLSIIQAFRAVES
jgi:hypothetical protein